MMRETSQSGGLSRPAKAIFWLGAVAGVTGVLLYFEQTSVIYVLSTLGLIILLLVVAFADLENISRGDEGRATPAPEVDAKRDQTGM